MIVKPILYFAAETAAFKKEIPQQNHTICAVFFGEPAVDQTLPIPDTVCDPGLLLGGGKFSVFVFGDYGVFPKDTFEVLNHQDVFW